MRGYNTGPNGETLANLAAWSYFDDGKLEEEMKYAIENGFLMGSTEAERNWVRQTVARLRSERFLLYQGKSQRPMNPYKTSYQGTSSRSSSPSPYSSNGVYGNGIYGNGTEDKPTNL